ncbi:MAG: HYR domain-containing protein, partial [Aequorivita sp.]
MKKITLLTILCMFLTIPIVVGQSSFKHAPGTFTSHGNTTINGAAGSASILNGNIAPLAPVIITQSTSQNIVSLNSVSCPAGDDSFLRNFNLASQGITNDFNVSGVEFGIEETSVPLTVTVNIYSMAPGAFPASYPAGATLQGSASIAITAANNMSIISLPLTATIPAGQNLIYELFAPDTTSGGNFYPGSNPDGQSGLTYIQSAPCGAGVPTDVGALGFPNMHIVFNVIGEEVTAPPVTYCGPLNFTYVEPITLVEMAGISNRTPGTSTIPHEDFTAIVGNVNAGSTYQIRLEGHTGGNFTNRFFVFVDWNQNGILNDAGEVYVVTDYLVNSTGNDGKHVLFDIDVPAGALAGPTRMRVKKTYGTSNYNNPCLTQTSFGQAEDYTINVSSVVGNPPVIVCPSDITASTGAGVCTAVVNFADAIAIDPEDGVIPTVQTAGPASGSAFPLGTTTVEFSATDSDGNVATCSFEVTVVDNEDPLAVCKDITVDLDPVTGMASITGADLDNGSSDNCGIASITLSKSSFDCSNIGDNTVTVTVTDNSGNTATCTSTVTVQDVTAPEVFCVGGFGIFTENENFEGASIPAGWTTVIVSGAHDWEFGSGTMPFGPSFTSNAAIFDDDAAGSGSGANKARLVSPAYDLTGASNVELSFDYALKQFIGDGTLEAEVWNGTAWQSILFVDADQPPINSGVIDVSGYVNAAFQVRFTYDDDNSWAWGAGVDTFLLEYEKASGGGLDVYLDANGVAVVDANDLVTGVNEACGYTITVGGGTGGGGAPGSITTLFASNNGGSPGWIQFFDITVGPSNIDITDLDVNTSNTTPINMEIYTLVGTSVGNELNAGAWGAPSATGTGTGAGTDNPSNVTLTAPLTLNANTTYGIGIKMDVSPRYTNGTGCPGNQCYSNADLSLSLGSVVSGQFSGSVFTPRIFNGTINYLGAPTSVIEFTCADLGENIVEVTVTDSSGNASTCMAVVNVIDITPPIIVCAGTPGIYTDVEDFEGSTIPSGWTTVIHAGSRDWTFGSGAMPTGGNFASNAAIFNDDAAGSGNVNKATLLSPVYNIAGSTTTSISFDYALQEFAGDGTLTVEAYDGTAWQQLLFVDTNTSPTNSGPIDMAAFVNDNFQVRFTYDDEGGWGWGAGVDNFVLDYEVVTAYAIDVELGPNGTTTIDPYDLIQSVDEACGLSSVAIDVPIVTCADIGAPITVTIFASDASGNITSCTTQINVVDRLAPVISCPANQTQDPGVGNLYYIVPDYFATGEATAIDNCTAPVTITTQSPAAGTALSDGTYTVTLTAEDEYGNVSTCTFQLTVESLIGIEENNLEKGVTLYPNPASSVVNLVNKTNLSLDKMVIYDINGKLINQIDLRSMQSEKS